jgi:hypothetical protein
MIFVLHITERKQNGDLYYYTDCGKLCFISPYPDNYKKLILPSFETDTNFKKEFENYSSFIRNKIRIRKAP